MSYIILESIRRVPTPTQGVKFAQPWRPAGMTGGTKIVGSVIDIRQTPVAHVKVQLRSLITGNIEKEVESNGNGEYEFGVDDPGTYVVEMVMADGYVVALSNAGSLSSFETMRTLVQLPGRWDTQSRTMVIPQNTSAFLGMSAQTTMTAATLTLAVDANIAPINPGEAVSAMTLRRRCPSSTARGPSRRNWRSASRWSSTNGRHVQGRVNRQQRCEARFFDNHRGRP